MGKRAPLTDAAGEVRELKPEDLATFRPAQDVLPAELQGTLGMRRRGPQKAPTKVVTTIRLDPDILAALKSSGPGWQTRVNDALRADIAAGRIKPA
ncbi:BrnA antitoxin family protein [Pseudorhodoferax sp.]|uniref:BrnA antitoxin family protein n=1 Tax=Pseudorhodoferax sp. TaxID=1993553 RepID=UPI002DD69BE9|nr:BrnA antitoxin family protein [Pseudorhodoferax sp.]